MKNSKGCKMFSKEDYEHSAKLQRLANRGAQKAQEETHKAGLPNAYSLNGKIIYQFPDGSITDRYEYPKKLNS
jgi:hypothetical protein